MQNGVAVRCKWRGLLWRKNNCPAKPHCMPMQNGVAPPGARGMGSPGDARPGRPGHGMSGLYADWLVITIKRRADLIYVFRITPWIRIINARGSAQYRKRACDCRSHPAHVMHACVRGRRPPWCGFISSGVSRRAGRGISERGAARVARAWNVRNKW